MNGLRGSLSVGPSRCERVMVRMSTAEADDRTGKGCREDVSD